MARKQNTATQARRPAAQRHPHGVKTNRAMSAVPSDEATQEKGEAMMARPPRYNFRDFEEKWRPQWEESGAHRVDLRHAKRPYYNLMMFPYPSAEGLHVGNVYAFVGSDIHGRFMAAQGYDVFEPMGFDAFGIHSENFAIKRRMHPRALTARNVERFREHQLKRIGNRFDWSHEVNTTDPRYYRWTQWIFAHLFKAGLAERKRAAVNWCPKDKTVLADEQVIAGHCERCGTAVERRELEQWFLKITAYADRLLQHLETLDWSERVKAAQRNWIGRSEGAEIRFRVASPGSNRREHKGRGEARKGNNEHGGSNPDGARSASEVAATPATSGPEIKVFTTRPDTVYGATFLVLAPEHRLVAAITTDDQREQVASYRREAAQRRAAATVSGERTFAGVFTGAFAHHPLTAEEIPIWIADYVLMEYGSGAIMAVPAHDERDLAFANAMGLPVRVVVRPNPVAPFPEAREGGTRSELASRIEANPPAGEGSGAAFTDDGVLVESRPFSGMTSAEARDAIIARLEAVGAGRRAVHYQLRDWLISRQRYWGPPIPIIYCPEHGAVAVPDDQLPVLLPELEDYLPTGTGDSPLAKIPEFVATTCPICGGPARRETDVMDNFLDSAWYFLRYPSSDDDTQPWDPEITRKWLPVSMYIGGAEHSVLHLLYSRFITMALHDLGMVPFDEPFRRFRAHGLIIKDGAKMAKSQGNVINPDEYIDTYGADALRTYLMFMGPYEAGGDFSDRGIGGVVRFLERVWRLVTEHSSRDITAKAARSAAQTPRRDSSGRSAGARVGAGREGAEEANGSSLPAPASSANSAVNPPGSRTMHAAIKRVSEDIPALKYNTAIAALMEYVNTLEDQPATSRAELRALLVLLAPFAPFIAEELWHRMGEPGSVHRQPWPTYDEAALRRELITLVVQVDGRVRDRIEIAVDTSAEAARAEVLASEKVQRAIGARIVRDVIFVPGRLANVVTAG
jgi:leucyl-tRNA synthetase